MSKPILRWKVGCAHTVTSVSVSSDNSVSLDRVSIAQGSSECSQMFSDDLVITASPDWPALCVYSADRWENVRTQLLALPNMDPEARKVQRRMLGYAHMISSDDRLQIDPPLAELAGLCKKDERCWLICFSPDSAEIWSDSNLNKLATGKLCQESPLIRFYRGRAGDHQGRTFDEVLALDDFWLEHTHDVIQWLFPVPEPSTYNLSVPVLTEEDRQWFASDAGLREQQVKALDRLLAFYGLVRTNGRIEAQSDLNPKKHIWLKAAGHNHLRISRIIRSLHYCHQPELAKVAQQAFVSIGAERGFVRQSSIEYWLKALD